MAARPEPAEVAQPSPRRDKAFPAAVWSGLAAYLCAAGLVWLDPRWIAVPLGGWLAACAAAPFLPRYGFYLPVISRGKTGRQAVVLTFDDGPDPLTTPALLRLLERFSAPATFFVTGRRAAAHPELIAAILGQGHSIGNHSYNHDTMLALGSRSGLRRDILAAQESLHRSGIRPLAYRPPVGITHPGLWPVLDEMGLYAVNFSCRGRDRGNRRIEGLADRILKRVRPDDIVMMHDLRPGNDRPVHIWTGEVEKVLEGLDRLGLEIVPLECFTGRPVMTAAGPDRRR